MLLNQVLLLAAGRSASHREYIRRVTGKHFAPTSFTQEKAARYHKSVASLITQFSRTYISKQNKQVSKLFFSLRITYTFNNQPIFYDTCHITKIAKVFVPRKKRSIVFEFSTSSSDHLERPVLSRDTLRNVALSITLLLTILVSTK